MVVQASDCRSQGCRDWVRAGRPQDRAVPVEQFAALVATHGYVVFTWPDESHLTAATPQDHTYFSATPWPDSTSPRWKCNACDIMPRDSDGMRGLTRLARQIIADKDAGVPGTEWIKYINWTDENGKIWQTSWKGAKRTVSNTDAGHLHLSGRTDYTTQTLTPYDPVARMEGDDMALSDPVNWKQQFMDPAKDYPLWLGGTLGNQLQYIRETTWMARAEQKALRQQVAALTAVVEQLAATIQAGGGTVDTAVIMAAVNKRLDELDVEMQASMAKMHADMAEAAFEGAQRAEKE